MKYSVIFSDAIHILVYLAIYQDHADVSSSTIAKSIETNPTNVRKIMVALKKADLIQTVVGKPQPRLTKPVQEITLLDIFNGVEPNKQLISVDHKTNPKCVIGGNIQVTLNKQYDRLQRIVEDSMAKTTLLMIIQDIGSRAIENDEQQAILFKKYMQERSE